MRKLNTKPTKTAKAKAAKTAKPVAAKAAKPAGHITRTAATIAKAQANFGSLSDRDTAYLGFYKRQASKHGGTVTLADLHGSGERPSYNGSNKPHDAGVIQRLSQAALISVRDGGNAFTITERGRTTKA